MWFWQFSEKITLKIPELINLGPQLRHPDSSKWDSDI